MERCKSTQTFIFAACLSWGLCCATWLHTLMITWITNSGESHRFLDSGASNLITSASKLKIETLAADGLNKKISFMGKSIIVHKKHSLHFFIISICSCTVPLSTFFFWSVTMNLYKFNRKNLTTVNCILCNVCDLFLNNCTEKWTHGNWITFDKKTLLF